MSASGYVHATCLLFGEHGLLIRGVSGAGKSRLAELLRREAAVVGRFARFVGDDRVRLAVRHGRVVAAAHPLLAGHHELRGLGLVEGLYEPQARLSLVIDLAEAPVERMPEDEPCIELIGIALPVLRLTAGDIGPFAVALVEQRLRQLEAITANIRSF